MSDTVSAVVGLFAGLWAALTQLVLNPGVEAAGGVFLFVLWTCIGVTVIADRRKPRVVRPHLEYAYGLTFEGCTPVYNPANAQGALQFQLLFRNYSSGPLRITLEKFDVRLGTRALPYVKRANPTTLVPRGGARLIRSIPFQLDDIKEFVGKSVKGTADFVVAYGHPDHIPVRYLKMVLELALELKDDGPSGYGDGILEESDEPISIR